MFGQVARKQLVKIQQATRNPIYSTLSDMVSNSELLLVSNF